jgi:hypothetical protein
MSATQKIILLDFLGNPVGRESSNEMQLLSDYNDSFPHSYLVVNQDHKIHPVSLFRRMGKAEDTSEALHLRELNELFPDKLDFSKTPEEKHDLKKARTKGVLNMEYEQNQLIKAFVSVKHANLNVRITITKN